MKNMNTISNVYKDKSKILKMGIMTTKEKMSYLKKYNLSATLAASWVVDGNSYQTLHSGKPSFQTLL